MKDKNMEDEIQDLKLEISRLQNLVRATIDRLNRAEEKLAPLHRQRIDQEGLTVTFDGPGDKSPLGKSLGDIYKERYDNSVTTSYPVRNYGGPGNMPQE
jgi:hypothetical protein